MNKFFANALALGLGVAVLAPVGEATAQDRGWDRDRSGYDRDRYDNDRYRDSDRYRDRYRNSDRGGERAKHWGGYSYRDHDRSWDRDHDRRWDRHDRHRYSYNRYRAPARYVYPRGYYSYRWNIGHRLPSAYYSRPYYVDYRHYDLAPPPYGHRWVRVDNDVFLVAIASGLISHAIHDLFYY